MTHALVALLATCALTLGLGNGSRSAAAGTMEASHGLRLLLEHVAPRRGVNHRALAVVPLVADFGQRPVARTVGLEGIAWEPSPRPGAPQRVVLRRDPTPPAGPQPTVMLPSGTILRQGIYERLTLHPTFVPDEKPVLVDAVAVRSGVKPGAVPADAPRELGPPPPPEFRLTAFLHPKTEALSDLLGVESTLLGPAADDAGVSFARLDASAADRAAPIAATLLSLGTAYGGDVVGHVVFLGNRVIEIVVAPGGGVYRSLLTTESRGLAVGYVVWADTYGLDGVMAPKPDWAALQGEAARLVAALADASLRPERREESRPAAGSLWRVRATMQPGRTPTEVGWMLTDADETFSLLEVWPQGTSKILAPPLPTPGPPRPGDDDDDDSKRGGAETIPYLQRLLERLQELFPEGSPRIEALKQKLKGRPKLPQGKEAPGR